MKKREYLYHKSKAFDRYWQKYYSNLRNLIKNDLFIYGIAGTKCELDENGKVKIRPLTYDECLSYKINADKNVTIAKL
jgi:hypothetical protein